MEIGWKSDGFRPRRGISWSSLDPAVASEAVTYKKCGSGARFLKVQRAFEAPLKALKEKIKAF